jgi:hypothetical protein
MQDTITIHATLRHWHAAGYFRNTEGAPDALIPFLAFREEVVETMDRLASVVVVEG